MFFIPGQVVSALTFPGVVIHEIAHQLLCRWLKVPVFEVCYFRIQNPSGYVIHEKPREPWKNIAIGVGPFFINTIIGGLVASMGAIPVIKFHTGSLIDYFFIWLGVSIAMHAFPSTGDAKTIWDIIKEKETGIGLKLIGFPIVLIIYIGALLSVVWFDLFYGIAVAMVLPNLLIRMFV